MKKQFTVDEITKIGSKEVKELMDDADSGIETGGAVFANMFRQKKKGK